MSKGFDLICPHCGKDLAQVGIMYFQSEDLIGSWVPKAVHKGHPRGYFHLKTDDLEVHAIECRACKGDVLDLLCDQDVPMDVD